MDRLQHMEDRPMFPCRFPRIEAAKEIGAKAGLFWLLILFDMFLCMLLYHTCCTDYEEYEFYHMHHAQRKTYITQGINRRIVRLFNQREYSHWLENKIDFNERFSSYLGREWLNLYLASQEDFIAFVKRHPIFFAKPACGTGGNNVERIDASACKDFYSLRQYLMAKNQFLIEEHIPQHAALERLSPNCLNILRLITFFDGSNVHLLRAVLRTGNGLEKDTLFSGGMYAFVDERGIVQSGATDRTGNIWEKHPLTGLAFPGFRIPDFSKALQMVFQAAREIPQLRYTGWDVAITPNGPVLLEADPSTAAFQLKASHCPGRICGDLPTYRLYMKI